jgi:sugar (pentulose or hexulose) kinase
MGIDAWGVDFGLTDALGRLIANPLSYRDTARVDSVDPVLAAVGKERLFLGTGTFVIPIESIFNLHALREMNALEYHHGANYLHIPDLLISLLTGETVNEYTVATTSLMYDIPGKRWNRKILAELGLRNDFFCPEVMPGTPIGPILPDICEYYEIPGIPVRAVAGHDTASAVAATPLKQDEAYLSLGTWGVFGAETDSPVMDVAVMEAGYGNEGGADGGSFLARNITGLWIIQECVHHWQHETNRSYSWAEIEEAVMTEKPFRAFIDPDTPELGLPQGEMPDVVVRLCKTGGSNPPDTVGGISRCIYESLALRFREALESLQRLTKNTYRSIHLVGGGAQNRLLCRWVADATGTPVVAGPAEMAVLGNAILQLLSDGRVSDIEEGRRVIERSFEFTTYEPEDTDRWDNAYEEYRRQVYGN